MRSMLSLRAKTTLSWKTYAGDSLLAIAGVALVTGMIAVTHLYPTIPTIVCVYLPLIAILASTRGLYVAILTSVLAVLSFDFFLFPPTYNFLVLNTTDFLALMIFLATTVLTGQVPSALRRRVAQARSREHELRLFYQQAQELTLLQERQRLAHELHDSLAQILYVVGLEVETAEIALEHNPAQAKDSLNYIRGLTEAGLAEMRVLLFELRPESLEREGLVAALTKQVAVLRTRAHLRVEESLEEEPAISVERKQALYRIAQEALHNILKHAHASTVILHLASRADSIVLEVHDDGRGFDPTSAFPGHLGLHSMRERATQIGAMLTIESLPGHGTSVKVLVPRAKGKNDEHFLG